MTPPGWSIFARPALHEDVENRCQTPGRSGTRLTRAFRRRRALCQKHERQSGLKGMVWSLGRGSKCKFKPLAHDLSRSHASLESKSVQALDSERVLLSFLL